MKQSFVGLLTKYLHCCLAGEAQHIYRFSCTPL